jgi:trehalose 6-phosphate phosphatase
LSQDFIAMAVPLLAPDSALFLDIDGTLLDFEPRPEDTRVPPALLATIDALRRALGGALAVVSGRALADVDRLFAPLRLAAAGQHGAEARLAPDGATQRFAAPTGALAALLAALQPYLAAHPVVRAEHKGLSIAFHYRDAAREAPRLRETLDRAVAPHGAVLQLLDGHLCFDVRARSEHKGTVVEQFMTAPPFIGRVPVYIGDAETDEDGFVAVLAEGGRAIRVVNQPRATHATELFARPAELRQWLDDSAKALVAG